MDTPKKTPVILSRPKDTSLQAYKAWILEIAEKMTGKPAVNNLSDDQWVKKWQEFWSKP